MCFGLGITTGILAIIVDHKTDPPKFSEERRCENRLVDSTTHLDCAKGKSKSLCAGSEQDQVQRVRGSMASSGVSHSIDVKGYRPLVLVHSSGFNIVKLEHFLNMTI